MPKYTLLHGGLKTADGFKPAGSEVELTTDEAAKINARGEHVKLTAVLKAEAEAEKKKAEHIAKVTAKVEADIAAEEEKAKKGGAK